MPRSSTGKTKTVKEIVPTSAKLDLIDNWLNKMLDRFPAKGQITTSEIQDWHKDLAPFSLEAIDFAFDKMRMGIFFPMNGQVLDLCVSYEPNIPDSPAAALRCTSECKQNHGTTYNASDFFWMLIKLNAPCAVGPTKKMRKDRVSREEWNELLDECDRKREGGAARRGAEFRR